MAGGNVETIVSDELLVETGETFDPLRELFVAQAAKPAQLGAVNLRALTPFQRALLIIDGTVTKFIETYTLERVEVVRLRQSVQQLPAEHVWLEAAPGTTVIAREVLLRGKYSYTLFAYAASLIVPERLPEPVQRELAVDGQGLGRMLLESRIETYRELLWYNKEPARRLPADVRRLVDGELISRTYRILAGGQPIMLINEKFPSGDDRLPSHH